MASNPAIALRLQCTRPVARRGCAHRWAMIDDYSSSHLYMVLAATALVGVISLFTQVRRQMRSSWPTWLVIPLALWFALVLGAESKPPTGFHPEYLVTGESQPWC